MIDGIQPVLKYNEWIDYYSILFCLLKTVNLGLVKMVHDMFWMAEKVLTNGNSE